MGGTIGLNRRKGRLHVLGRNLIDALCQKKTILVVEDDHFLSDIYKRQLEGKGCKVVVA